MKTILVFSLTMLAVSGTPLFWGGGGANNGSNLVRTSCPHHLFVSCPSLGFFQHRDYCSLLNEKPCPEGYECCPSLPDFIFVKSKNGCCVQFYKVTTTPKPRTTTTQRVTEPPTTTTQRVTESPTTTSTEWVTERPTERVTESPTTTLEPETTITKETITSTDPTTTTTTKQTTTTTQQTRSSTKPTTTTITERVTEEPATTTLEEVTTVEVVITTEEFTTDEVKIEGGGTTEPNMIRSSCPSYLSISCPPDGSSQHRDFCSMLNDKPCPDGYECCPSEPFIIFVKRKEGCCVQFYKANSPVLEISRHPTGK